METLFYVFCIKVLLEQIYDQMFKKAGLWKKFKRSNVQITLSEHAEVLNCPTPELMTSTDLARGRLLTRPNLQMAGLWQKA